ncbi:MAG TPA: hypothetical protein VKA76_00245 [Gammaproteobacteria bacterium]|nr:hypothetical protein [Gammaproteobacteria bacterium]
MKSPLLPAVLAGSALFIAVPALSQTPLRTPDQTRSQSRTRDQLRDQQIYGHQLMTPQERDRYRDRLRAARSEHDRARIRQQHIERMQERARQRGMSLGPPPMRRPTSPPAGGRMGPGGGSGSPMGPGGRR